MYIIRENFSKNFDFIFEVNIPYVLYIFCYPFSDSTATSYE